MDLLNSAQDWMNGDDGEKRRQEEIRQMRMARAREDRLRGLAAASVPNTFATDQYNAARAIEAPHFAAHKSIVDGINSSIQDEMDSRVAQAREARRMEHEKYLANIRLQMAQKEQEGQIIRSLLGE